MKNFFVIFNAVVLANICTLVFYETYLTFKQKNQLEIEHAMMETVPDYRQAENNTPAELDDPQGSQQEAAASKQALETLRKTKRLCDYWMAEYKKEPTGLNEALKEKACLKYNKLKPATPSEE